MAVTTQSLRAVRRPAAGRIGLRRLLVAASLLTGMLMAGVPDARAAGDVGSVSGLRIPRFVSLKADRVNVRAGPNKDQDVRWVYTRAGMPVEITAEFENWRRIRDWEGAEGWVYHSLLSGKRTAVVVPTLKTDLVPLYESPSIVATVTARLQSGVLTQIRSCTGKWCEVSGKNFSGYIMQDRLWGAYPNEKVE